MSGRDGRDGRGHGDERLLNEIHDQLTELEAAVGQPADRQEVDELRARVTRAAVGDTFGRRIHKYTTRDIAEAFVGSIFFAIPLLVEDGVFDVAEHFLAFRIGQFPVFLLLNAVFVLVMVSSLLYWTRLQEVQMSRPLFGLVPRRLVGISVVSFLTAAAMMTMWGRVDNWQNPTIALARISAVWTVASFGAALGDILPGESSGDDINVELEQFGEQVEELVEQFD